MKMPRELKIGDKVKVITKYSKLYHKKLNDNKICLIDSINPSTNYSSNNYGINICNIYFYDKNELQLVISDANIKCRNVK